MGVVTGNVTGLELAASWYDAANHALIQTAPFDC